jgi:hypothetical protein
MSVVVDVHYMKSGKLGEEDKALSNKGSLAGSVSFNISARWM